VCVCVCACVRAHFCKVMYVNITLNDKIKIKSEGYGTENMCGKMASV